MAEDAEKAALPQSLLEKPATDDAKQALVPRASEVDVEGGEQPSSSIFNKGPRPVQDVRYGWVFLAAMLVLFIRELSVFFWPLLSLRLFDPATFTVLPLLAIGTGLLITVPGCFLLLWLSRGVKASHVRLSLVVACGLFLLSFVFTLLSHFANEGGAGTEEYPDPRFGQEGEQGTNMPGLRGSSAVGSIGDPSESSLIEAAIPGSISRILREVTAQSFGPRREKHAILLHHSAGSVARRILHMAVPMQRDRLLLTESSLNDLLNGAGVLFILYTCEGLFPLVALIISDSSKFVLTRGRGLVFALVALVAAAVLLLLPFISVALQVVRACAGELQGSLSHDISAHSQPQLCQIWKDAFVTDLLSGSIFTALAIFLAFWLGAQVAHHSWSRCLHVLIGGQHSQETRHFQSQLPSIYCMPPSHTVLTGVQQYDQGSDKSLDDLLVSSPS